MTRKRPDVQLCGKRHYHYLHCLTCNPPPAERPERLQGPEIGAECIYDERHAVITERSYVWAPGDPVYHGGSRRYDWKVIRFLDTGKTLCVDDKDLELLEA